MAAREAPDLQPVNAKSSQQEVLKTNGAEGSPTLRADELNLFDETVVAISSVGPAYSLAATMGLLFVAVAYAGPAVIIVSFLPMLFIAVAYFWLKSRDPNCGAGYEWISKLVSPRAGWFNGWVQLCASVLFMEAVVVLAADYTLQFIHSVGWTSHLLTNAWLVAGIAVVWLALITFITVYSVRWTANTQWAFMLLQYGVLLGTSTGGIVKVAAQHPAGSTGFHLSWLGPSLDQRLPGPGGRRRPRPVLLLGLGHRGQPQRGVQERQQDTRASRDHLDVLPGLHLRSRHRGGPDAPAREGL